jgi:hypothetical protein
MDEGWTRFIFDKELDVPYATLHDADIRTGGLAQRFDAIVIPDQSPRSLVSGYARGTMPPEFTGGLGDDGVAALKAFVEDGGTLVTFNEASKLATGNLGLSVRNALEPAEGSPAASADFYCPGALLGVTPDFSQPVVHGLDAATVIWFEDSPAFEPGPGARAALTYADDDPLRSGWLLGGGKLKGKAALVEVTLGKGRVVMFGFRPQYRAQSWATYVPMMNALYLAAAR